MEFTSLSAEELQYYLDKIRRIAKMDDDIALAELDELLYNASKELSDCDLVEEGDDDLSFWREAAKEHLDGFEKRLDQHRRNIANGNYYPGSAESLRAYAEHYLGDDYAFQYDQIHQEFEGQIERLRDEGLRIADEIEEKDARQKVWSANNDAIASVRSVRKLLRELSEAEELLERNELMSDELRRDIRSGRERCAFYRAKKKLEKAEVLEAGGRKVKAERLRNEAEVQLRQDWEKVFPSEKPPSIRDI